HFHEFLPPEGLSVPPGGRWRFTVEGLTRAPKHMTSGVKSAMVGSCLVNEWPGSRLVSRHAFAA
ncbi:hypothetical protein ACC743_38790, partial [Rhizobium ruizarguesonis]